MTTLVERPAGSRREAIRHNAADLFADRGYSSVRVQDIAQAVGITPGAIYKHFPSKDALLDSVLLEMVDVWIEASSIRGIDAKIDAGLALVVARPGEVATFMSERHRASKSARSDLRAREQVLGQAWELEMRAAVPDLTADDVLVRQFAFEGVFGALARLPARLSGARAKRIVGSALHGLSVGPPSTPLPEPEPANPRWNGALTRRHEILHTALRLFSRRGYDGVSLNDIGEAVGIAGPSIYEHFSSKAALLRDAYDRSAAIVAVGFEAAVLEAADAHDALDRLIATYVQVCFQNADLIAVTAREARALPPTDRERVARHRRETRTAWVGVLREARPDLSANDAETLAWCAFPLIQHVALRAARRRPRAQAHLAHAVRSFLYAKEQP